MSIKFNANLPKIAVTQPKSAPVAKPAEAVEQRPLDSFGPNIAKGLNELRASMRDEAKANREAKAGLAEERKGAAELVKSAGEHSAAVADNAKGTAEVDKGVQDIGKGVGELMASAGDRVKAAQERTAGIKDLLLPRMIRG